MAVKTFFPPGHFHSPIVDPAKVQGHVERSRTLSVEALRAIRLDPHGMLDLWQGWLPALTTTLISQQKTPDRRYHEEGGPFPFGDAMSYRAVLAWARPHRIIEIGSGFSTACALDALDEFDIKAAITCIEPYPNRLRSLMRPTDYQRVEIIESEVQQVPLHLFEQLERGDILFIDSTHVLKTGSDVHFELFEILPCLRPGVLVHFHDCPYPFEYPPEWISEDRNYSWNEAYALRAFLTYNKAFEILFWMSMLRKLFTERIYKDMPQLTSRNPGSSIWLRKTTAM